MEIAVEHDNVAPLTVAKRDRSRVDNQDSGAETSLNSLQKFRFSPAAAIVYQPRFTDQNRKKIKAIIKTADGRLKEFEGSTDPATSSLMRDVLGQYTVEEIEFFSQREWRMLEQKKEVDRQAAADQLVEEEREMTFQAKAKALEIPAVQNCTNQEIVRKIRRAKNPIEVAAWVSIALSESIKSKNEQNNDKGE